MKKSLSVALAAVFLSACAATGVKVTDDQVSQFKEGETTRSEVVAALGSPTSTMRHSDGTSTLIYTYAESRTRASTFVPVVGIFAGGVDMRSSQVILDFDENGILVGSTSSEDEFGTASGIAVDAGDPVLDQPRKPN